MIVMIDLFIAVFMNPLTILVVSIFLLPPVLALIKWKLEKSPGASAVSGHREPAPARPPPWGPTKRPLTRRMADPLGACFTAEDAPRRPRCWVSSRRVYDVPRLHLNQEVSPRWRAGHDGGTCADRVSDAAGEAGAGSAAFRGRQVSPTGSSRSYEGRRNGFSVQLDKAHGVSAKGTLDFLNDSPFELNIDLYASFGLHLGVAVSVIFPVSLAGWHALVYVWLSELFLHGCVAPVGRLLPRRARSDVAEAQATAHRGSDPSAARP